MASWIDWPVATVAPHRAAFPVVGVGVSVPGSIDGVGVIVGLVGVGEDKGGVEEDSGGEGDDAVSVGVGAVFASTNTRLHTS